jgi:hypothetical protein
MRISVTRFSVVVAVALQWIAAIALILISRKNERLFADFNATLPHVSAIALQVTKPLVLVPIAMLTTAIVVIAESLLQSVGSRLVIQAIVVVLWAVLAFACLLAIELPLVTIVEKLQ